MYSFETYGLIFIAAFFIVIQKLFGHSSMNKKGSFVFLKAEKEINNYHVAQSIFVLKN